MTPLGILLWQSATAISMIILSQSFEVDVISRRDAFYIIKQICCINMKHDI